MTSSSVNVLEGTRCTDKQRDHALGHLRDALARGALPQREFEGRLRRAMHARTTEDLGNLTSDLPEWTPPLPPHIRHPAWAVVRISGMAGAWLMWGLGELWLWVMSIASGAWSASDATGTQFALAMLAVFGTIAWLAVTVFGGHVPGDTWRER